MAARVIGLAALRDDFMLMGDSCAFVGRYGDLRLKLAGFGSLVLSKALD
jgi:hypothetical protein